MWLLLTNINYIAHNKQETGQKGRGDTLSLTMAQNPAQNPQPQQGPKQKWKVGSFLQQAVAGVESKLDLILAEEEQQQQLQQLQQMQSRNAATKAKQADSPGGMG